MSHPAALAPKHSEAANDPAAPTLAELAALADGTDRSKPDTSPLFHPEAAQVARYLRSQPPARQWLLRELLPAGIVALLVAPGGTGKTMFALQLGAALAIGGRFANTWDVENPGATLLLLAEDDDFELHRRCCGIADHIAKDCPEAMALLGERLYVRSMVAQTCLITSAPAGSRDVEHTPLVERIIATAQQIPDLRLIVIDPASRWRGGEENDSQTATRFVQALERIAQATGAAVLAIHHANKGAAGAQEASQGAARGSSALVDGVRLVINLATLNGTTRKKWGIPEEEVRSYLTLAVTKANYSAPQPEVLLHRGGGGYLEKADAGTTRLKEPSRADTEIIKKVRGAAASGKQLTRTAFVKQYGGIDGPFKMGEKALASLLGELIEAGHIRTDGRHLS